MTRGERVMFGLCLVVACAIGWGLKNYLDMPTVYKSVFTEEVLCVLDRNDRVISFESVKDKKYHTRLSKTCPCGPVNPPNNTKVKFDTRVKT